MSTIERFSTNARMSGAVTCAGRVFLSGQVPTDLDAPAAEQTQQVLGKIDALLAQAGSDRSRLLTAQIWLKNIGRDFDAMNSVWESWLPEGCSPARATVQAELARPGVLVEIMVVAELSRAG